MEPYIRVENLTHTYSAGTPFEMTAVRDLSFDVFKGEFLSIIGQTGSGKSTLLQHLNGLIKPTSGKVYVDGEDIGADKSAARRARFKVGLVFQYPEYQLFDETVEKDISFGPKNMGLSPDEVHERVVWAAKSVGLPAELLDKSPFEISGGQKRRAAIAGVIAMRPDVLILDEPIAGLDPQGRRDIMRFVRAYRDETGSAIIMVTHSMEDAAENSDRMLVLSRGELKFSGTPREVFSRSDELSEMGLDLPESAKIALALKRRGVDIPDGIYTSDALISAIKALKGVGRDA